MDMITRFGLSRDQFTILIMLSVLAAGMMSYLNLPKRENPAITVRTAVVQATFDGMSPERVENLIAIPMERKLREIGEVEDIKTIITSGQALVYVYLYDNVPIPDIENAWEDLRNKMDDVAVEFPEGTAGPFVNTDFGDVSIATVAVTGDGFDMAQIDDVADELRRELYRVDGITKVSKFGVQDQRIWLLIDNRKLASVGVQLDQVLADLQAQNVILPAGEIDADGGSIVLEANGDLRTVDEIRNVLTKVDGLAGYVRLRDLVTVERGFVDPKEQPVFYNGRPAVVLGVEMADTADIQPLGVVLKDRIQAFENTQPIGISVDISTFQETAVTESVTSALVNVGQTFVVVFLVMLAFLGLRAAFVIACIVPFTVMFALMMMGGLDIDVEQVSIAAVIISLGLLVDNGLVVVEDIEGRINAGVPPETAALEAGGQYLLPLGVASITTVSAFIPMLLIHGTEGEFAFSLGAVVASMLLGSWLTALYVLPFLSARLLKRKDKAGAEKGWMIRTYGEATRALLPYGLLVMIGTFALVAVCATQFSKLRPEMFPLSERTEVLVYMTMPKGTAISATEEYALAIEDWFSNEAINSGVANTTIYVGDGGPRFYLSLDPEAPDPTKAFFVVVMEDFEAAKEIMPRARRVFMEQFPAARFRVTGLAMGGGEGGIVDVEISGPDADALMAAGVRMEAAFDAAPALVKNEADWGNKVLKVVVDIAQDKAREFDVTSEEISQVMEAYFSGTTYSTYREGDEQIPIVLRADVPYRDSLEDFVNLSIAANGQLISIDQVATFRPELEYSEIRRENQVRQIIISAKSLDLSAQDLLALAQPELDALMADLGPAYRVNIAGELEDSADIYGQLSGNLPTALVVMFLALVFQFNSLKRAVLTFMTIPIILIGAPFALMLAGQPMSFFAVLGLMSLMGIIINNAIVLINQIDLDLETMPLADAIVSASEQRARPIMLTSLTTIFGLTPMALTGGVLFEPMATIMIGGMLIASPLTLFFVPCVYALLIGKRSDLMPSKPTAEAKAEEAAAA